jgi:hypothetical protein
VVVERPSPQAEFSDMLDRAWMDDEEYEEDVVDHGQVDDSDPLMPLLCALHTDLSDADDAKDSPVPSSPSDLLWNLEK